MKYCGHCKKQKPLSEFYKDKKNKDGLYSWCKQCKILANQKRYHKGGRIQAVKNSLIRQKKIQSEWKLYFNKINPEPKCEICQKDLQYFSGKNFTSVNFDHRKETKIIVNPCQWLTSHHPIKKYIKIWEDSDFGILCLICNKMLPTKDRLEWIKAVLKYIKSYTTFKRGGEKWNSKKR